jgi:hypothetical protein
MTSFPDSRKQIYRKAIKDLRLDDKKLHLENDKKLGYYFRVSRKACLILIGPFLVFAERTRDNPAASTATIPLLRLQFVSAAIAHAQ